MRRKIPKSFNCPSEFTLEVLGGKWKTVILCFLKERPCRYAELRKLVPKLSEKMLTQRLADLVAFGLVERKKLRSGKTGDGYFLTDRGQSLGAILQDLYVWGSDHAGPFGVQVGDPLKKLQLK